MGLRLRRINSRRQHKGNKMLRNSSRSKACGSYITGEYQTLQPECETACSSDARAVCSSRCITGHL